MKWLIETTEKIFWLVSRMTERTQHSTGRICAVLAPRFQFIYNSRCGHYAAVWSVHSWLELLFGGTWCRCNVNTALAGAGSIKVDHHGCHIATQNASFVWWNGEINAVITRPSHNVHYALHSHSVSLSIRHPTGMFFSKGFGSSTSYPKWLTVLMNFKNSRWRSILHWWMRTAVFYVLVRELSATDHWVTTEWPLTPIKIWTNTARTSCPVHAACNSRTKKL